MWNGTQAVFGAFNRRCRHTMVITQNLLNSGWVHAVAYGLCFPLHHPLCHSLQGVWAYSIITASSLSHVNCFLSAELSMLHTIQTCRWLEQPGTVSVFRRFLLNQIRFFLWQRLGPLLLSVLILESPLASVHLVNMHMVFHTRFPDMI